MRQLFREVVGGGSGSDVNARVVILIFIIMYLKTYERKIGPRFCDSGGKKCLNMKLRHLKFNFSILLNESNCK